MQRTWRGVANEAILRESFTQSHRETLASFEGKKYRQSEESSEFKSIEHQHVIKCVVYFSMRIVAHWKADYLSLHTI